MDVTPFFFSLLLFSSFLFNNFFLHLLKHAFEIAEMVDGIRIGLGKRWRMFWMLVTFVFLNGFVVVVVVPASPSGWWSWRIAGCAIYACKWSTIDWGAPGSFTSFFLHILFSFISSSGHLFFPSSFHVPGGAAGRIKKKRRRRRWREEKEGGSSSFSLLSPLNRA